MSVTLTLKEYDEMQENKRLLEEQNKELKALHEKIETLQKEKIEAMQSNEHSVTITETKRVYQHVYVERPEYEIHQRLRSLGIELNMPAISAQSVAEYLLGTCYEFRESVSESINPMEDKVYSVSLTQMRANLRKEVEDELDEKVKRKLDDYDELSDKYMSLKASSKKDLKSAQTLNKNLESELASKVKRIEELEKQAEVAQEEMDGLLEKLGYSVEINTLLKECEKDLRFIPMFSGKEYAKKVHSKLSNFMVEHKIKRYE